MTDVHLLTGDDELAQIGAAIRNARTAAGLTQEQLGVALGTTQTAVSYWESGKREPGVTDLLRISRALGIAPESLLPSGPARVWLVVNARPFGHEPGGGVLPHPGPSPMIATLDGPEAHAFARLHRAVVAALPVIADYRERDEAEAPEDGRG